MHKVKLLLAAVGMLAACVQPSGPVKESGHDCSCIDPSRFGSLSLICQPERSCGEIELSCDYGDDVADGAGDSECVRSPGRLVADEQAIACALDHLITGEPTVISFTDYVSESEGIRGQYYWGGFVQILPDRAGVGRTWNIRDREASDSAVSFFGLKDPAYFEECRAKTSLKDRFDCVTDWAAGESLLVCDDPGADEPSY